MKRKNTLSKVIYGLRCCSTSDCDICPYSIDEWTCDKRVLYEDAAMLLEAREPKPVMNVHKKFNNVTNSDMPWVGKCPKCGKLVEGRNLTIYCKYCGQALKWHD